MVEMLTEFIFVKPLLSFMIALWISLSLMESLAMTMLQISCSLSVRHSRRHVGGPTNWDLA